MPDSADVVTMAFRGAQTSTRRPAIVVSSAEYHRHRPDIVVGIVTTNVSAATTPTDHVLRDWQAAGLRQPSAFRCYLNTVLPSEVQVIGRLSPDDWRSIQVCLSRAFGLPTPS
jgi:mRNA interferase MazF